MKNIFLKLYTFFVPQKKTVIEKAVDQIIVNHAASLKKLDQYDRGEIQETRDMVKYPAVRDYLRKIQSSAS